MPNKSSSCFVDDLLDRVPKQIIKPALVLVCLAVCDCATDYELQTPTINICDGLMHKLLFC